MKKNNIKSSIESRLKELLLNFEFLEDEEIYHTLYDEIKNINATDLPSGLIFQIIDSEGNEFVIKAFALTVEVKNGKFIFKVNEINRSKYFPYNIGFGLYYSLKEGLIKKTSSYPVTIDVDCEDGDYINLTYEFTLNDVTIEKALESIKQLFDEVQLKLDNINQEVEEFTRKSLKL